MFFRKPVVLHFAGSLHGHWRLLVHLGRRFGRVLFFRVPNLLLVFRVELLFPGRMHGSGGQLVHLQRRLRKLLFFRVPNLLVFKSGKLL